jgi:hypothetical protein
MSSRGGQICKMKKPKSIKDIPIHGKDGMPTTYMGKSTRPGGGGRFAEVEAAAKKSGAKNPAAVAAMAGRKKYGAKKMAKWAAAGKKRAARGNK